MGFLDALKAPVINDVSTDVDTPPAFTKSTHSDTLPDSFKAAIAKHYTDIQPLKIPNSTTASILESFKTAVESTMPSISVVHFDPVQGVMELLDTTKIMKFKDDISVRAKQVGADVLVDIRSASRVGKGDLGCNANRIRNLFAALKTASKL